MDVSLDCGEARAFFGVALFDSEISLVQASKRLKLKGLRASGPAGPEPYFRLFRYFSVLEGKWCRQFSCYSYLIL
jgi:hypothetical protein